MKHLIRLYFSTIAIVLFFTAFSIAQSSWQATAGPEGGSIKAMGINSNGDIFIGSSSGVFRSVDNAGSWEKSNNGIFSSFFTSFAVNDSDDIFVGTTNLGIYRSTDNGDNWQSINTDLPKKDVKSIDIWNDGELIIGINGGGVFRSQDNGESWSEFNNGLEDLRVYATAVSAEGDVYGGTLSTGIYRFLASDTTWRQVSNGLATLRCNALETNATGDVFAGTNTGIFMLNKGDTTWSELKNGTQSLGYVSSVFIDKNEGLFATTLAGAFKYDPIAGIWNAINDGLTNLRVWGIAENDNGQLFLINDAGVSRSEDGGASWAYKVNGLKISRVTALHVLAGGTLVAATENNGIARSFDEGDTWAYSNTGLSSVSTKSMVVDSSGTIFVGVSGVNGLFRSTDQGGNWTLLQNIFGSSSVGSFAVNKSRIYASPTSAVFFSEDGGDNWEAVPLGGLLNKNIRGLAVNSENTLFAGTWNGGIFRIAEGDTAWTQVNNGLTSLLVYTLKINAKGELFVGTNGGGVFRSVDNGDNWVAVNEGIPSLYIKTLAISDAGHIFAGAFGMAAYSMDNGESWTDMSEGLDAINVSTFAVQADGKVYAGSSGNGVFSNSALVTAINSEPGQAPNVFTLNQNYPNPFNPVTTISFTIGNPANITVKVFDNTGREIRTLFQGKVSAGLHAVSWDGKNARGRQVASGAYYYSVESKGFKSVKKMTLLK